MDPEPSLSSWPDRLQEDSLMATSNEDEFTNFLEFGMPFPDLSTGQHHNSPAARQQSLPPHSLPNNPPVSLPPSPAGQDHFAHMDAESCPAAFDFSGHDGSQQNPPSAGLSVAYSTTAAMAPDYYAQEQPPQQAPFHTNPNLPEKHLHQPANSHYHIANGQTMIPPTPNSIELRGNAARYHESHDIYTSMNDEQAYYTPAISPAMTPLEPDLRFPEYTIPGEYFTPLTSPALEGQNANTNNNYPFPQGAQFSDMGFMQSPVDNAVPSSSAPSSPGLMRKHRRHPSTNANRFSSRAKKQQSPSVRPQTRKKSLLSINPDDILNGLSEDPSKAKANDGGGGLRIETKESSGPDSVSPEPLSEPLMPPPAIPHARSSPALASQLAAAQSQQTNGPATPAMLMRIQRSQQHTQDLTSQFASQSNLVPGADSRDDGMKDIALPEAASPATQHPGPRPKMARIDTAIPSGVPTPAASTHTTPALEPKSAPADRNHPSSVAPSPRSIAMPSPSGPIAKKSGTPKLGPSSRKRPSVSTQPSPQLRSKISPSIQPLVPRGEGISSEISALELANKSNYQQILEGRLLPGVTYPNALTENVNSKRASHKLAEQGRRNRINNALKEIEALIPVQFAQMKTAKDAAASNVKPSDKEKEKAGNQAISKASTVEMAIDYILALQQELGTTKTKLAAAESKLAERESNDCEDVPSSESNEEATANTTTEHNGPSTESA